MKLEKEVYIDNYYFDYSVGLNGKNDILKLNTEKLFTEEERKFIDKNLGKKVKLTLEVEEPILNEEERKYLSGVIRPFRDRVEFIRKCCIFEQEYINVVYNSKFKDDTNFCLPLFEANTMYRSMELDKEYTLEELGL